jgi:hypothetical protein
MHLFDNTIKKQTQMGLNLNLSLLLQNKKTAAYHYLVSKPGIRQSACVQGLRQAIDCLSIKPIARPINRLTGYFPE